MTEQDKYIPFQQQGYVYYITLYSLLMF